MLLDDPQFKDPVTTSVEVVIEGDRERDGAYQANADFLAALEAWLKAAYPDRSIAASKSGVFDRDEDEG